MTLVDLSLVELVERLRDGRATSVEATAAYLDQIDRRDGRIQAFLRVDRDRAIAQAEAIDQKRRRGEPLGLLAGCPIAIKDVLCTEGEPTTCASRMLENFVPPYDATVVARLKAADGVLIGKTNMDEFAMGGSSENSAFQVTRNPWNLEHTPGGSSGGSAACVAARMAPGAIGTDTGGSIRQPAGWCGVTGIKPTYGRVSRYGLIAFASSLDQVGVLARSAQDAALLLESIAGHDPRDSTSVDRPTPSYSTAVDRPLENLRIGVVPSHFDQGLDGEVESAVRGAIDQFRDLGATIVDVELPHARYGVAAYYVIAPCEASSNLARYDGAHYGRRTDRKAMIAQLQAEQKALSQAGDAAGLDALDSPLVRMYRQSRAEGFGPEVKRRIMLGTYALSAGYYDAYYLKAMKVRRLIRRDYDEVFSKVDLIVGPVASTPALRLGEKAGDPLAMYLVDLYTVGANLAGIPGMSIPCGFATSGLPIGLQLQAPPFEEERLLRASHMLQKTSNWHTKRPDSL